MGRIELLYSAIIDGDDQAAQKATESALAAGASPEPLVQESLIPAMDEVGRRFEEGECFVPDLLLAARAMKRALTLLRPALAQCGCPPAGRVVLGTVAGDQHDIGKNLVGAMLEGGGFEVIDLGYDIPVTRFVEAARDHEAGIVGLSALLTTTMPAMKAVIDELAAAGLRDRTRVMIGGAPITQGYAHDIGADGYAANANAAVALARKLTADD